tara:strand:+ start:636 stop:1034 length:399 start_codon:yes stop_codon:yes gene_type:complete
MEKNDISTQLIALQNSLNKFITRINGDDWTPSLIQEIKDTLHRIDKNPESLKVNKLHFDKLNLFCRVACDIMIKLSEYITNLNIRYTSENANKKLLDETLNNFKMQVSIVQEKAITDMVATNIMEKERKMEK